MSFLGRKKLKLEDLNISDLSSVSVESPLSTSIKEECPPLYVNTGLCTCTNCLRLGKCTIEKVSKAIKCSRVIRACSVKAKDRGDPPACGSLIVEEFFDYIMGKYIGRI